jgi:pyruvate dehydrogenase E1 component beta subunit
MKGEVPDGDYVTPIGKAKVVREGKDVTLVSYSMMMNHAIKAADELEKDGISVELIDLRSVSPIDEETILNSVAKTTRLVIAHEAVKRCGVGAEIAALVAEKAIDCLDAPIVRVGSPFTPVPSPSRLRGHTCHRRNDRGRDTGML